MMPRRHAVHDLAEEMAKRHFEIQAEYIFERTDHSKTSVTPVVKRWADVSPQDRQDAIEELRLRVLPVQRLKAFPFAPGEDVLRVRERGYPPPVA